MMTNWASFMNALAVIVQHRGLRMWVQMSKMSDAENECWDTSNSIPLGSDHSYDFIYGDALWWEDNWPKKKWLNITHKNGSPEEILTGMVIWHKRPDNGETCGVLIHFMRPLQTSEKELDYPIWEVSMMKPLSIHPSIICKVCKDHGFIKEGRWLGI